MKNNYGKWVIFIITFLIILVWVLAPILLQFMYDTLEKRALFGDSYGVLNSLFSGLAFAGVIIAILLQRDELRLQREELKLTREELKKSAEAQDRSGNYLGEQSQVMKISAELNCLSSLIKARTEQINYLNNEREKGVPNLVSQIENLNREREQNIRELELMMHSIACASEH